MFRLTRLLDQILQDSPLPTTRRAVAPVVVWNLIRRCNLSCLHCYAASSDRDFRNELSHPEVMQTLDDLKRAGVTALILSGGEPLLRPDLFEIATAAKTLGFHLALSTNGTLIDAAMARHIAGVAFDYVGISIDGMEARHDVIRGETGAFNQALDGVRHLRDQDVTVGLRCTLTRDNTADLPELLQLMDRERIPRLYLSHLNYAGRGIGNRQEAPSHEATRQAVRLLFDTARADRHRDRPREFVTGNNDADGVLLLHYVQEFWPDRAERAASLLRHWGGNASGVGIANIDNRGFVHPDIFWWDHVLGNVREKPFGEIWQQARDELMVGLRQRPRPVKGRCGECGHLAICGGNTRVRAFHATGDAWAEDPGCYLTDAEIAPAQGI
ncbi:MAG: heme d1 biosynthesis radical SAM protein NirJ [Magnetococcales bacterium]|nr:heme d1 biosynthesis radical SAM protein NirJ [Magnetococcales bacterium]